MTTIAYKNGFIAADTCGMTNRGENNEQKIHMTKIRMSQDKRAIFGIPGPSIDGENYLKIEKYILDHILRFHVRSDILDRDNDWTLELPGQFVVFTKVGIFVVGRRLFQLHELIHPYAVGSGAGMALVAMKAGKGAQAAVNFVKQHDLVTGGDVDVMRMSSLRPFIRTAKEVMAEAYKNA